MRILTLFVLFTLTPALAETTELILKGGDFEKATPVIRSRLQKAGASDIKIVTQDSELKVAFRGELTPAAIKAAVLGSKVEFRETREDGAWHTVLDNRHLKRAHASFQEGTGHWVLSLEATPEGTEVLAEVTRRLVGKPLGIFVNDEEKQAPIVNEPILKGKAVIWGLSKEEASKLADDIGSGLPTELVSIDTH